jgi:DMSO reductase anchor subunit
MHPAYSVILFTTASGFGYGLLIWLAVLGALGLLPVTRGFGIAGFAIALGLVIVGLLSSTAHLGRPERAWRAFSQWRTSWLSREGVLAVAGFAPALTLAAHWVLLQRIDGSFVMLASLSAAFSSLTLYTTGMIYASLQTIRQWHQPLTAPLYVALGVASGAVLLNWLLHISGSATPWTGGLATLGLLLTLALKVAYWQAIDRAPLRYTAESATGLGRIGKVRQLEPPHTQANFVMREMGYRIGRRHAGRLRLIASVLAFVIPAAASLVTLLPGAGLLAASIACVSCAAGLLVERWLFFAEAEHVVTLYYGASRA